MREPGSAPLLDIRALHLRMRSFEGEAHVLNGVDLRVERGQIWGLVGETGCGKSLTGLSVSRLVPSPPARYTGGQVLFDGVDLLGLPERELRGLRGRRIGMIFQDPATNLNPLFRIGAQLRDVALSSAQASPSLLGLEQGASARVRHRAARDLAIRMLERVRIPDAARRIDDYPHQFSGGMRQRVLIAMALIGQPDLLIADEPTTALDVGVQAQILDVLDALVADTSMGVLLITHNLAVVAQRCTHIAVMYAGSVVERGPVDAVLDTPAHPYTAALLQALPRRSTRPGSLRGIPGSVPDLVHPPSGCRFAPRCDRAQSLCASPPTEQSVPVASSLHRVTCWHPLEPARAAQPGAAS